MNDNIPNGSQPNSRFESVLAEIQQAEEQGRTIDQRQYLDRFPDLAEPLRDYFCDREWFAPVAARLAPTATPPGTPPCLEVGPGSLFGGYAVLQEVGHGGRGVVYRVSDSELKRPLAVKVLRPEFRDEPDAVRRLLEEAQVTGQLQHPGIVPVHAIGRLPDGRPYFAMKLVEGRDLADLLAERPAPAHDLPRFLGIFEKVCQAVAYAHSRGVINRDLKPKNVMVGAFAEVQVMDWGFAKVLRGDGASQGSLAGETQAATPGGQATIRTVRTEATGQSSADGLIMGTIAYMSPEQAKGQVEQLDARVDVFGLGALLCEILTGLPPYAGAPAWKLHQMAEAGDLADAFARLDGCGADAELIALAKDCLAPEREGRPRDAGVVAERVATYLAGVQERLRRAELEKAAAQARAEEARATVRAERRARRLTFGLAVAVLAVVVSLAVGGLWLQRQQAEEARQAEALRREVGALLAQAIRFRQSAHFEESRDLLEQARQRLGPDGPADLREQVDQALADTRLARRLDAARHLPLSVEGGKPANAVVVAEYAAALKEAGLGHEGEDAGVMAARVRASAVRAEVVAALDQWAGIAGDGRRLAWLLAVARAADPDPQRDRLRQPRLWQDSAALARRARVARVPELSPQLAAALGRALSQTGGDAVGLLREAHSHHPHDFGLNFELGLLLYHAKKWDESIGYYRAALALRPRAPGVHYNLGLVLYEKGQRNEAIERYKRAVEIDPKFAAAHSNLGVALYDKGRVDDAIEHYTKALTINPRDAKTHNSLGNALARKGRPEEAIEHYKKALDIDPKYAKAHSNLGNVLQEKGEVGEAIDHYEKALATDPRDAKTHNNLGNALARKGRLNEAIGEWKKALRINDKLTEPHYSLGNALRANGQLDEAIDHWKKAIAIDPRHAPAHHNLGVALYNKGRLDEAISHFKKAVQGDSKFIPAHSALGQALVELGQFAEARAATLRCLDLVPRTDPFRPALMQQLRRCDHLLALEGRLPAILSRKEKPAGAAEGLQLGWICQATKRYADAVRLYADAFAAAPKLRVLRYNAACCAALAAAALKPNDKEQPRLRRQALDWLRADLALWKQQAESGNATGRALTQRTLSAWQNNPSLASVRDKQGLGKLPDTERKAWQKLWADVEALRKRMRQTK
jgi:serine/threonine-protein kinase